MLLPNIIKVNCGTDWILTFTIEDPFSKAPATPENTIVKFGLYASPTTADPLWTCGWNTGVQQDPITAGMVHIAIPTDTVSKYLPPGIFTFKLNIVSKANPTYVSEHTGTLESVPMSPNGVVVFDKADPVAREMIGAETMRALAAEEKLAADIRDVQQGTFLADGSVTTAKLADKSVTGDKIADESIPINKIDPLAIADVDAVAQALIPYIRVGDVTSVDEGDDPEVTANARDGYFFFNFALAPGYTPEITDDGFWKIGDKVTNIRAEGRDGAGISDISEVSSDPATGYTTYRITWSYADGTIAGTYDFSLYSKPTTDEVSPNSIQPVTSSGVYSAMINDVPQQLLSDGKLMFSATTTELSDLSTTITDFHVSRAYYLGQNFKRIPLESAEGIVALPDLIATDNLNGVGLDLHITTAESIQIDVSLELHRQEGTSYYSAFPYGLWKPAWAGAVAPIADAEFSIDSSNVLLGLAVIFSGETSWLRLTCTLGDLVSSDAVYGRVLTTDDYGRLQAQITSILDQLSQ